MLRGLRLRLYNLNDQLVGEHTFAGLPIRIGRNGLNDCPIPQNFVSDFHARIEEADGRLFVRDLNSKNGVFVRHDPRRTPQRVATQLAVELSASGNEFFVGPFLRIAVEPIETDDVADRGPKSIGAVLGNRQMLEGSSRGSAPSLPSPDPRFAPDPNAAYPAPNAYPDAQKIKTGHFTLTMEALALQGLREIASSLVPGRQLETNGDVARLVTKLHDAIEVFCRCFIPLRQGYAQFVSSMDLQRAALQRSVNRSRSYAAIETADDPATIALALLDWKDQSFDAPKAIDGIFADLMVHQMALLDGVMQGVRALLDELSPENLERSYEATDGRGPLGLALGRYKGLWETFCQRYEELSEEKQAFSRIFGPEFTQAYREYRRARTDGAGPTR